MGGAGAAPQLKIWGHLNDFHAMSWAGAFQADLGENGEPQVGLSYS